MRPNWKWLWRRTSDEPPKKDIWQPWHEKISFYLSHETLKKCIYISSDISIHQESSLWLQDQWMYISYSNSSDLSLKCEYWLGSYRSCAQREWWLLIEDLLDPDHLVLWSIYLLYKGQNQKPYFFLHNPGDCCVDWFSLKINALFLLSMMFLWILNGSWFPGPTLP